MSQQLIQDIFLKHFSVEKAGNVFLTDSALLPASSSSLAFTTDSYVVHPVFFPGGTIGKLAVCGTVNDLSVAGAVPAYMSASFIIEEGFPLKDLEDIVKDMASEAENAGIKIVTGDTKIVYKGQCDGLFINTSGVGLMNAKYATMSTGETIQKGDRIIVSGNLGEHSIAVMAARQDLNIQTDITSDCASLNGLIHQVLKQGDQVKFMRDITRGGLATIVCELMENSDWGAELYEDAIPVRDNVRGICEILGFDPLYLANEGKLLMVVDPADADHVLEVMQKHPLGQNSAIIGEITDNHPGMPVLKTKIGGRRVIDMLAGEQLPRIC